MTSSKKATQDAIREEHYGKYKFKPKINHRSSWDARPEDLRSCTKMSVANERKKP